MVTVNRLVGGSSPSRGARYTFQEVQESTKNPHTDKVCGFFVVQRGVTKFGSNRPL